VIELKWPPNIIGGLFYDRIDYLGLLFWYDTVNEKIKRMKPRVNPEQ
jgi:hypothetical protein